MVMRILTTDEYLYEKKRDILILQLKSPKPGLLFYSEGYDEETERLANEQLTWFNEQGIDYRHTCSPSTLAGWHGSYYIDIDPIDSLVGEYVKKFENEDGASLHPEYYQMIALSYDAWVSNGKLEKHEQHLKDIQDPDYNI